MHPPLNESIFISIKDNDTEFFTEQFVYVFMSIFPNMLIFNSSNLLEQPTNA